ncbi:MAG: MFS transporter [Candidatus Bathyarchaeia archaeon]
MTSQKISWLIVFVCYISYAYVVTCIGPVLSALSKEFALTPDFMGIIANFSSVGALIALLGGWIANRHNKVSIIAASVAALATSCLGLWLSPNPLIVAISLLIMGGMTGFMEPAINAYVSDLYPQKRGASVTLLHIGWNIGSTFGPLFSALIIATIAGWRQVYLFPLPVLLILLVLLVKLRKKERENPSVINHPFTTIRSSLKVLPIVSIAIFDVGVEMGISTWLPFILENQGSTVYEAGLTAGLFWGFMGFGRLVWASVIERLGYVRTIMASTCMVLPCMLGATLLNSLLHKMVLWIVSGFLLSPVFPAIIAWGISVEPKSASTITGLTVTLGAVGQFASIFLIGLVAAVFGVAKAQYVFAFLILVIIIDLLSLRKTYKVKN